MMRLDCFLVARGDFPSRTKAAQAIKAGFVTVDGIVRDAAHPIDGISEVIVSPFHRYASRGGEKLAAAFAAFHIDAKNKICADLGASNGGFTQVLLDHGARRVYAVDVGENQLDPQVAADPRVVVMDRINARNLDRYSFPEEIGFTVCDVSFISLKMILPAIALYLSGGGEAVALVKPQFEGGAASLGKGGIVRNFAVHRRVIAEVLDLAEGLGLYPAELTHAPVRKEKNVEYLVRLTRARAQRPQIEKIVEEAKLLWS